MPDHKDVLMELAAKLKSHQLAIFCGAGLSMLAPSNLPNWRMLTDSLVTAVFNAAKVPQDDDRSPKREQLIAQNLRPDVVMQILYDVLGESVLQSLNVLDVKLPNANHYLIAHLAAKGYLKCVISTNYDQLIEIACEQVGVPVHVVVTAEDYTNLPHEYEGLMLFKVHGSVDRPQTLIARINNISRGLDEHKADVVESLLAKYHFLFLGYSGNDFAINADYLLLERAKTNSQGFSWMLRPGESSVIVTELLHQYGAKSQQVNANLPDFLLTLCESINEKPASVPDAAPGDTVAVEAWMEIWGKTISQQMACYGLGRLYLHAGMWDEAINSIKIFYRITRDAANDVYTMGIASYYLAHAYERWKWFNKWDTLTVGDIMILLNQAKISFSYPGDELMLARTFHTLARYYSFDNFDHARDLFNQAIAGYQAQEALAELGETYVDIGDILSQANAEAAEYAWNYLQEGFHCAKAVGDLRQMVRAYSGLGYILMFEDRIEESAKIYDQALRWVHILGDRSLLPVILHRYGSVLTQLGQLEQARDYLKESLELFESAASVHPTITGRNALALVYEQLGDLDAAGKEYALAMVTAELFKLPLPLNNAKMGLARISFAKGDFASAKSTAQEVLLECEQFSFPNFASAVELLEKTTARLIEMREAETPHE